MYQLWFLLAIGKKYIFKWSPVIYGKSYHIEENYGCIQIRHHRPYLRTLLPTCSPYNCGSKWYLLLLMLQPLKHQPRCLQWSMCLIHLLLFSCTNDKQRWDRFCNSCTNHQAIKYTEVFRSWWYRFCKKLLLVINSVNQWVTIYQKKIQRAGISLEDQRIKLKSQKTLWRDEATHRC